MTILHLIYFLFFTWNKNVISTNTSEPQLILVQTIWRHGDRSAAIGLFPIDEDDWIFGGGGLAELSMEGMEQSFRLGTIIRQRYVNQLKFLSKKYKNNEIRVEATNYNRTIQTGATVTSGIYPPEVYKNSSTIPFVLIPIHRISPNILNTEHNCNRDQELQEKVRASEFSEKWQEKWKSWEDEVFNNYQLEITWLNRWLLPDTIHCQRNHFNETLYEKCAWYNEQFYEQTQQYSRFLKQSAEGVFNEISFHGQIDLGKEIQIIRGGPVINDIYDRAVEKSKCLQMNCGSYLDTIKFYAYSAHDTSIYRVLVILGITRVTEPLVWPDYSSAIFFEFYRLNNQTYFKVLYRANDNSDIKSVTNLIKQCNNEELCPLSVLQTFANEFKPIPNVETVR